MKTFKNICEDLNLECTKFINAKLNVVCDLYLVETAVDSEKIPIYCAVLDELWSANKEAYDALIEFKEDASISGITCLAFTQSKIDEFKRILSDTESFEMKHALKIYKEKSGVQ